MCGIFGYVGSPTNAAQTVLDGLKILEYRGYDSWGIASKTDRRFVVEKHVGKIGKGILNKKLLINTSLAIGHTRWATHGGATMANAHPHLDCKAHIAVVHNGIVENFETIKKNLENKGHKFLSTTDSEVIPHLIEENMKKNGFATSVRDAFNKLTGMNAIVVANAESSEIITAKTGSPLVIGQGKGVLYVASDATSILPNTKKLLFLQDNQMAILGKTIQVLSLPKGLKQKAEFKTITWKLKETNKGSFPDFLIKEIYDQPEVIRNIAKTYHVQVKSIADIIKKAKGTFFIGAGTASYAGIAGTYFFSKIAKKHVNMSFASEFPYLLDFLTPKSLVIALSQSGETIDVVEPLTKVKEIGSTIVSLTNTEGSTIYRMSDKHLLLGAGSEHAVASTKAYIAKLSILLMLAFAVKNNLSHATDQLLKTASQIEHILKQESKLRPIVDLMSKSEHIYIIGRGASYSSSLEAALKIKEITYIHAEGLAGGELKHGALALISKGTPCIVFAPNDETYQSIISNATEIKTRGGIIIGISHVPHAIFDYWIEVKDCEDASVIAQIIPIQLLSYHIAVKKGLDPDKPRNLAKSVTVK